MSGSIIAWAWFLLRPVSHCEVESLRSANLILRRLVLAHFIPWVIVSWSRAATAALRRGRSLVLSTKSPLLSVGLDIGVCGIVFAGAWLHLRPISLGEIVSLSSSNPVLWW